MDASQDNQSIGYLSPHVIMWRPSAWQPMTPSDKEHLGLFLHEGGNKHILLTVLNQESHI